jgi:hypothetical protein
VEYFGVTLEFSSGVTECINECGRAVDLLIIARNNREKTPNLTDQDFSLVQNDLNDYCARVEKMKTDINLLILRVNNYLQQVDSDKTL